jgi:myo-inositol-1(or 4)-monophosphatase
MFWAEENEGCWLENKRLRVASRRKLNEAVVTTGIPQLGVDGFEKFVDEMVAVRNEVAAVRRFGSAALDLAWVAAGRFDGFWERGLEPWDIAGGVLLVREAGGYVSAIDGGRLALDGRSILAATDTLHRPLLELLAEPGKAAG